MAVPVVVRVNDPSVVDLGHLLDWFLVLVLDPLLFNLRHAVNTKGKQLDPSGLIDEVISLPQIA